MRFHAPDGRVLQVERIGGLHTYAARVERGPWTALGGLRTVALEALGAQTDAAWLDRMEAYVTAGESLPRALTAADHAADGAALAAGA
ncbi:hypothetical protein [Patulibacter sp. SYSU D01012]|uniref:hypothetical protein n=1 Tax=Patulibacter sp. SYSU D01012 TaxID=2817381 RepID=UPI001B3152EB|nr:hypothetical protein [Patulibacter sp. SYSU D01012]